MRVVGDPIFVPAELKPEPTPPVTPESTPAQELYKVRKTWEDAKSQIGAYHNLDSAIDIAKSNAGYSVFDSNGNCKYDGLAIEVPKEEPKIEETRPPVDPTPSIPEEPNTAPAKKESFWAELLKTILTAILDFFKGK